MSRSVVSVTGRSRPVALAASMLVCLAVFIGVVGLVLGHEASFIDRPVLTEAVEHRVEALDGPMTVLTHASEIPLLFVSVLVAAVLARRDRSWRPLVLVAGTGVLSVAVSTVAKEVTDRTRPPAAFWAVPEDGFCFPSRHAVIATAVLLIMAYVIGQHMRSRAGRVAVWAGASVLACLVGLSRVYLAVHWATDVLAGLPLGAMLGLAVVLADVLWRHRGSVPGGGGADAGAAARGAD